jgi:hypothetical protein
MRKLQSLKIKGVKNSKKANHQTLQGQFPNTPKKIFYVKKLKKTNHQT